MISSCQRILPFALFAFFSISALAQPHLRDGKPRKKRIHTATEAQELNYYPTTENAPAPNAVSITIEGDKRVITANGMPEHKIGTFPNRGNPNIPSEQDFKVELPLDPVTNEKPADARGAVGVLVNGVLIESGTGEFWYPKEGDASWNYNALGGAIDLGVDQNHAHVQPSGKYHYHGVPTGLMQDFSSTEHSPIIGWAFDGFPIYGLYGYADGEDASSKIIENTSSYRLKKGTRPSAPLGPGGAYDGAFNEDFEYVAGLGTLDECNGRFTVTPEFPDGTYAYFITLDWPVFHTKFRGTSVVQRRGRRSGPRR